eukprot:641114-Heterocapsa_arctica.AAC.1
MYIWGDHIPEGSRGILQVDTPSVSCKGRRPAQLIRSIQGGGSSGNALSTPYTPYTSTPLSSNI